MVVYDEISLIIWSVYFIELRGYQLNENILYQDNQIAMKLDNNGKLSSGNCTSHINIWYFFATYHCHSKELSVEYCPNIEIIGDYSNHPLQGGLFRIFRNLILGMTEDDIISYNYKSAKSIKKNKVDSNTINSAV